jgi:hypothetical protein
MKQIRNFLLIILGLLLFLSCEIVSPYVDAVFLKMDEDKLNDAATGTVAMVSGFDASAASYDASMSEGLMTISWNAPVAYGSQTEAVQTIVRGSGGILTDHNSGFSVYDGSTSTIQATYPVALNDQYNFGIWTADAAGNVSDGQFDSATISDTTLSILYDGYTYDYYDWGSYSYVDVSRFGNEPLLINESRTEYSYIFLKFEAMTVSNVINTRLKLYVENAGNVVNIEIAEPSTSWSSATSASTLNSMTAGSQTSYTLGSTGTYTNWDISIFVQDWESNPDYGLRLDDTSGGTNTSFTCSEDSVTANRPELIIYYGTD